MKGSELIGLKYEPIYNYYKNEQFYRVVADNFGYPVTFDAVGNAITHLGYTVNNAYASRQIRQFVRDYGSKYLTYGETISDTVNLQKFVVGDYICRDKSNHKDVWVVAGKIFANTYEVDHLI